MVNLKKHEESLKYFDKAIELEAGYYEAYFNKGQELFCNNKYDEAIQFYNKALEIKPDFKMAKNYK